VNLLNLPKTDAVEAEDVTVSEILLHNYQLSLMNARNALQLGQRAANKGGRSV